VIKTNSLGIPSWTSDLPYTCGLYGPVHDEVTATDLEVVGEIPKDLAGLYVHNTPNPAFAPSAGHSWFDGDGMVHGVRFEDGRASYRNRFVRTTGLAEDLGAARATYVGSLAAPGAGRRHKHVANTDVVFHAGRLLALGWEGDKPYELSVPDLATRGTFDYGGTLRGGLTSHAKLDPKTGELYFFDWGRRAPFLRMGVASREGTIVRDVAIETPSPSMQHDMALSEKYALVFDMQGFQMAFPKGASQIAFDFDRARPTRFGLVDRRPGHDTVRWFEVEPCWIWHTMCAWDDGDEFVLVGARIAEPVRTRADDDAPYVDGLYREEDYLHEWRLDVKTSRVRERQLDDQWIEFPRVNDAHLVSGARYGYAARITRSATLRANGYSKYDLGNGRRTDVSLPRGHFGIEPNFAPAVGAKSEDDGYVLSFVTDESTLRSECWVIDGRSFSAEPVARIRLPQRVPAGFHGRFIPAHELGKDTVR